MANAFNDIEGTSIILSSTELRHNVIRQILAYAALYDLDGINLDFENIYLKDRDAYTQFVREISPLLREQGLVVSVAVGVPEAVRHSPFPMTGVPWVRLWIMFVS